jgi:hypothetical protein
MSGLPEIGTYWCAGRQQPISPISGSPEIGNYTAQVGNSRPAWLKAREPGISYVETALLFSPIAIRALRVSRSGTS